MIRFACPRCGKHFRKDDNFAGRKVRCGACGHEFRAPASISPPPAPAPAPPPVSQPAPSVFVPAAPPPPPPRPRASVRRPRAFGWRFGLVATIGPILTVAWCLRMALGATPLGAAWDAIGILMTLGLFGLLLVGPIAIPIALSRRRRLSMGRWVLMAVACGMVAALILGGYWIKGLAGGSDFELGRSMGQGTVMVAPLVLAVLGCVVAAAVYPK